MSPELLVVRLGRGHDLVIRQQGAPSCTPVVSEKWPGTSRHKSKTHQVSARPVVGVLGRVNGVPFHLILRGELRELGVGDGAELGVGHVVGRDFGTKVLLAGRRRQGTERGS